MLSARRLRIAISGALLFAPGCGNSDDAGSTSASGATAGATTGSSVAVSSSGGGGDPTGAGGGSSSASTGMGGATGSGGGGGFVVSDCGADKLADIAGTLSPGSWAELPSPTFDAALIDAGGGHHIMEYSDKGVWDPNTCQALFVGGGHLTQVKYIAYSASTDQWFQAPNPSWWCDTSQASNPYECATHAYQHDALDPKTGRMFFRKFNTDTVWVHQVDATIDSDWTALPTLPSSAANCIATGIEYFPERDELVYVDCTSQALLTSSGGTQPWQTHDGPFEMGPYHDWAVYDPFHHVVLFGLGNGSTGLHAYDANGMVTQRAAPPYQFHPSPENDTTLKIFTVDPATGKYLAVSLAGDLYEYDLGADAWSSLGAPLPQGLTVAIPISSYGVVMFLSSDPAKVYLYKHGP